MSICIKDQIQNMNLVIGCTVGVQTWGSLHIVSLAASQNARSYGQTINHRALRICKKRIQKVLMLSPCILINVFSYLLSDSYNGTLFKSLHSVYVKRYWLIIFVFVNRR